MPPRPNDVNGCTALPAPPLDDGLPIARVVPAQRSDVNVESHVGIMTCRSGAVFDTDDGRTGSSDEEPVFVWSKGVMVTDERELASRIASLPVALPAERVQAIAKRLEK